MTGTSHRPLFYSSLITHVTDISENQYRWLFYKFTSVFYQNQFRNILVDLNSFLTSFFSFTYSKMYVYEMTGLNGQTFFIRLLVIEIYWFKTWYLGISKLYRSAYHMVLRCLVFVLGGCDWDLFFSDNSKKSGLKA